MKRLNLGFTLIELMIVVAIIGILVAVGMPQYQNYVARSQAAEGFSLAGGLKTALAEYHDTHGVFPDSTTDAHTAIGIEPAGNIVGKYVTDVTVSNDGEGTITAKFGSGYHTGKFLRLAPTATDGAVYFDCTTDIEESYRPSGCEEGVETVDAEPTPWVFGTDKDACWDQDYADGAGGGNGWVEGETTNPNLGSNSTVHGWARANFCPAEGCSLGLSGGLNCVSD